MGYEKSSERWSPVQSVEKVLLSVMSMLAEPNIESPANVDAAKMYRDNYAEFVKIAQKHVMLTLEEDDDEDEADNSNKEGSNSSSSSSNQ